MDATADPTASRRDSDNGSSGLDACGRAGRCRRRISRLCLLDSIGCGLYGAAQPWGSDRRPTSRSASAAAARPRCLRGSDKVSPADAALANGTAIHGFEIDDAHVSSSLHPGAVTLPAGLAVGRGGGTPRAPNCSTALAAGYEVGLRVGICAGVSHSTSGYHVTGTVGALGAAAAAARVLQLSPGQTAHALGIGATQAAGLYAARTGRHDQALSRRPRLAKRRARALILRSAASPAASMRSKRRSAAS